MNIVELKSKKTADIELTPLINIVFLMLIFFLLVGSLKPTEVIDPVRTSPGDPALGTAPSNTITLLHSGGLLLGDTPVEQQELLERLNANAHGLEVLAIKPDAGLQAAALVELLQLLRQGGFLSVQLLSVADSGKQ